MGEYFKCRDVQIQHVGSCVKRDGDRRGHAASKVLVYDVDDTGLITRRLVKGHRSDAMCAGFWDLSVSSCSRNAILFSESNPASP